MRIIKKIQCLKCSSIIEENGTCDCGKVQIINNNLITEGVLGKDYIDMSAVLLNENL